MPKIHSQPLHLSLNYSRHLHYLVILAHLLALFAALSTSLPITYQLALFLVVTGNYLQTAKRLKNTPINLVYSQATGWQMAANQDLVAIKILPSSVLSNQALFLHLEITEKGTKLFGIAEKIKPSRRKSVLIMSDALDTDDFRRLMVKLKTTWREPTHA